MCWSRRILERLSYNTDVEPTKGTPDHTLDLLLFKANLIRTGPSNERLTRTVLEKLLCGETSDVKDEVMGRINRRFSELPNHKFGSKEDREIFEKSVSVAFTKEYVRATDRENFAKIKAVCSSVLPWYASWITSVSSEANTKIDDAVRDVMRTVKMFMTLAVYSVAVPSEINISL